MALKQGFHTGGVGDNGADDAGNVAGRERDAELGALAVRVLGLGEDVRVEQLDDLRDCISSGKAHD
jgi:hypothetical protein